MTKSVSTAIGIFQPLLKDNTNADTLRLINTYEAAAPLFLILAVFHFDSPTCVYVPEQLGSKVRK